MSAGALDTPRNVAARVFAILTRYRTLGPAKFEAIFGPAMAQKAVEIETVLAAYPGPFAEDALCDYLAANRGALNLLAAIAQQGTPFEQVLTEELDAIDASRHARGAAAPVDPADEPAARARASRLVGLAFSGGGIRSATFNLGVLQGAAGKPLFRRIDYLSTVSGGGYIGSWLATWIRGDHEKGHGRFAAVETQLSDPDREPDPVTFLRDYSNYLTPQKGMFTADSWVLALTWMRNVFLNLLVLITAAAALLLVPRIVKLAQDAIYPYVKDDWTTEPLVHALAIAAVLIAVAVGVHLRAFEWKKTYPWQRQGWVITISAAALAVCWLCATRLWYWDADSDWNNALVVIGWLSAIFFVDLLAMELAGGFIACFLSRTSMPLPRLGALFYLLGYPLATAVVWGGLLFGLLHVFTRWFDEPAGVWHFTVFGGPALLFIFCVAFALHLGLMGRYFPDERREWLTRWAAWLFILSLGTAALAAAAIYGPWAWREIGVQIRNAWAVKSGAVLAWAGSTVWGLLRAKNGQAAGEKSGTSPAVAVVPYVFMIGAFVAVASGVHALLCLTLAKPQKTYWGELEHTPGSMVLLAFAVSAALAYTLSRCIDINEFSMHHFYKNRLVRCYLGASRGADRKFNPFTGFDRADDKPLATYLPRYEYEGPYPIVNCALNLTHGERLAWQERKASSFVFTPAYSGFEMDGRRTAYRPTNVFAYPVNGDQEGGIHIGSAMAISGAAASPNMGYHSSTPLAFMMTVFDVRLGWWLGNPARDRSGGFTSPTVPWRDAGPSLGLTYLVTELFGLTNANRSYVYLSDGGHFENLAIYELVRRRCALIIACDAEEDGDMKFGGLGNAIRKCRTDFQTEIDVDVARLRKAAGSRNSEAHCCVGDIRYPGGFTGALLYVKSSLTGDEPTDVLEYASRELTFPHQTTADQFFDESQFESYRRLGRHISEDFLTPWRVPLLFREAGDPDQTDLVIAWRDVAEAAIAAGLDVIPPLEYWLPENRPRPAATGGQSHPLGSELVRVMNLARKTLSLDANYASRSNRGWMNLFRYWAGCPEFVATSKGDAATVAFVQEHLLIA